MTATRPLLGLALNTNLPVTTGAKNDCSSSFSGGTTMMGAPPAPPLALPPVAEPVPPRPTLGLLPPNCAPLPAKDPDDAVVPALPMLPFEGPAPLAVGVGSISLQCRQTR